MIAEVLVSSCLALAPPSALVEGPYRKPIAVELFNMLVTVAIRNRDLPTGQGDPRSLVMIGRDDGLLWDFWKDGWSAFGLSMGMGDKTPPLYALGRADQKQFPFLKHSLAVVWYRISMPMEPLVLRESVIGIGQALKAGGFLVADSLERGHANTILKALNFEKLPFLFRADERWFAIWQKMSPPHSDPKRLKEAA